MVTMCVQVIGGKISVHYLFLAGGNQNLVTRPLPDLDQKSGNSGNYRGNPVIYLVKYNSAGNCTGKYMYTVPEILSARAA